MKQVKIANNRLLFILDTLANSNPDYEMLLDEWLEAVPESYIPYLVKAYYYYDVAWSWRGHQSSDKTSAARIDRMNSFLKLSAIELTEAIRLKPRLSAADALAIRILMMLDNNKFKEQTMQEALQIDQGSYLVRASYLWSLKPEWGGDPKKLIKFARKTSDKARSFPQLTPLKGYADYIFAESLLEQRRYKEAILHFDFAVDKGADHYIYRDRGINYYYLKRFELALADFDKSLSLWPQNPQVLRWRAQTLSKLQRNEEALDDLDTARRLSPMNRYILMSEAYLLRKMKRFEQVLSNYEKALYYNEWDADIWFARGMHYSHELINFEAAAIDFAMSTKLAPKRADYWYEYAAVLHYNVDCKITEPLLNYLELCDSGSICKRAEVKWASDAKNMAGTIRTLSTHGKQTELN